MIHSRLPALLFITALLSGCLAEPLITKPDDPAHQLQNENISLALLHVAETGDWLVTRGYHATDNLVANATRIPISHAAVFNLQSLQVIEAEGKGVHLSTLADFIDRSQRILVIRPRWRTGDNATQAWNGAMQLVGKNYDFLGTIGFNFPDKYYCSELVVNIYQPWQSANEKFPDVILPGELYLYGKILYDSLPRE